MVWSRELSVLLDCYIALSSSKTLLSLYTTIVRPILEYGSAIWDPPSASLSSSIESVQYFALKMIQKSWSAPYADFLSSLKLHTLQHRRLQSKLLTFFKFNNGFLHSVLPPVLHPLSPPMSLQHFCPDDFVVPFCRTSAYFHSSSPLQSDFGIPFQRQLKAPIQSLIFNSMLPVNYDLSSPTFH